MARKKQSTRLRKQPTVRRMRSATAVSRPRRQISKTAKQRRRRNNRRVSVPTQSIKQVVFTSRWISLGLLALTLYALFIIGNDSRYYLTYIPVDGTVTISPAEIVAATELAGSHIFAADPSAAAEQISAISGITSATVTLSWPNEVQIKITEESPIALWRDNGLTYWITEGGGLIYSQTSIAGLLSIVSEIPVIEEVETAPVDSEIGISGITESGTDESEASVEEIKDVPTPSLAFIPTAVLEGALQLQELRPNIEQLYYRPNGGLSYQDGLQALHI